MSPAQIHRLALTGVRQPVQAGVSTAFPFATEAATSILQQGGNAVDAAVAAAWALSVCEPSASGLGGQTTLLLYSAGGDIRVIDGHSYAPRRVSEDSVSPEDQKRGYRSCTIPSTPATLQYAHKKYGRLEWRRVLAPAIRTAEWGFKITPLQCKQTRWVAKYLRANPAASDLFLRNGEPPQAGETFSQFQLGETLQSIAEVGVDDFYRGALARHIADDMRDNGGLMDEEDLANFSLPVEREPLSVRLRRFEVCTIPPPGGGLQLLLALKLLERILPSTAEATPEDWYVAIALSIYAAFDSRESFPVAPNDFIPAVQELLLSEDRVARIVANLSLEPPTSAVAGEGPGDTTHLTVADDKGNIVALTQSIQSVFGAKVANKKLGFLYNNYLRTCPRSTHPSQLGINCLARSNATPVLILENTPAGKLPVLALGSAGSRRITSSILQVISHVLDRGKTLQEALDAPRIHALLSRRVWIERRIALPGLIEKLGKQFSKVVMKPPYSFGMGAVHAVQFLHGKTIAAADPRRDGATAVLPQRHGGIGPLWKT